MSRTFFYILTTIFLFFFPASYILSQAELTWEDLAEVKYVSVMDEDLGYAYMKAKYGQSLQDQNGKEIVIEGYILPMDLESKQYALSAYPFSACFFCGGGGRESVIELWLAEPNQEFVLDDIVTFKGIFQLNDDQFGLNYILKDAVQVKTK
ncbi:MAG: DUF3299 domain-containing protein [Bacteroidota bacterium]